MQKTASLILVCLLSLGARAQKGNVEVVKDPRLDLLVKKQGSAILPSTAVEIDGYRLQLFFDTDRKEVDKARSKFISSQPSVDTYIIYNAPNYILKVGDFRQYHQAEKLKDASAQEFPTSFVIKEKINLPKLEE
jgi:hypothetical protein